MGALLERGPARPRSWDDIDLARSILNLKGGGRSDERAEFVSMVKMQNLVRVTCLEVMGGGAGTLARSSTVGSTSTSCVGASTTTGAWASRAQSAR